MPKLKRIRRKRPARKKLPTLLILGGIALLLIAVFALKSGGDSPSSTSLEAQLDNALTEGRPTIVFLHSLDCIPCKEMMATVGNVYPDFQDSVVLIDVDVYLKNNQNILRREQLQSIPTLVFYDALGNRQVIIGTMTPEQLRDALTLLAVGQ